MPEADRESTPPPAAASGGARTNLQLTEERVLDAMQVKDDASIKKTRDRRKEIAEKRALTAKMREATRKDYKKLYYAIRKRTTMQERETQAQQIEAEREARSAAKTDATPLEADVRHVTDADVQVDSKTGPAMLVLAAAGAAYAFSALNR